MSIFGYFWRELSGLAKNGSGSLKKAWARRLAQ